MLDNSKDLIIAFDIGGAAGTGGFATVAGCNLFLRGPNTVPPGPITAEATKADRSSGPPANLDYLKADDSVYLVQQIDVLA